MAKIYFRYGCMGSSKTANALMAQYNYQERGQEALLLKPSVDNRDGESTVGSRIGLKAEATVVPPTMDIFKYVLTRKKDGFWMFPDAVIVDEVQFLTQQQIKELCRIADDLDIPVLCYGLRTNFKGELFPATETLMALADTIEELKTVCWCGKKATINARVIDGKIMHDGPEIMIGGNESYMALCRKHWMEGAIDVAHAKHPYDGIAKLFSD